MAAQSMTLTHRVGGRSSSSGRSFARRFSSAKTGHMIKDRSGVVMLMLATSAGTATARATRYGTAALAEKNGKRTEDRPPPRFAPPRANTDVCVQFLAT